MLRTEVIQKIIDTKAARRYLEIGVFAGDNFFAIRAPSKTAVDPSFAFTTRKRIKWSVLNPTNITAHYRSMTSDDYFESRRAVDRADVVFIDGLHTYEQAWRDLQHSLDALNPGGVVVMHDCSPPHAAAAYPAASIHHAERAQVPGWTGEWCGDVWKVICRARSACPELDVFVLDCDYGVGVVRKGKPDSRLNLTIDDLDRMDYADLERDRSRLLNLKDTAYLQTFLECLR